MKYLLGFLFFGLITFSIGGVLFFFILQQVQLRGYLKMMDKIDGLNKN